MNQTHCNGVGRARARKQLCRVWRQAARWSVAAALFAVANVGCVARVDVTDDEAGDGPGRIGAGNDADGLDGIPCRYLTGEAELVDYDGSNYPEASFSFKFGTQDQDVTHNDYDISFEQNLFRVNNVVDDVSFIVDLGEVSLFEVPASVEPSDYAVGAWGEHDNVAAEIGHTYFVRNQDGFGRTVSAFVVEGLEPGRRVHISWIRSPAPDTMVVPTECM